MGIPSFPQKKGGKDGARKYKAKAKRPKALRSGRVDGCLARSLLRESIEFHFKVSLIFWAKER